MNFFFTSFFTLIISSTLLGQIRITGKILTKKDSLPISYANIRLDKSSIGTSSNSDGEFQLTIPNNSSIRKLKSSHINFTESTFVLKKNIQDSLFLTLFMTEDTMKLEEFIVSSKSAYQLLKKSYSDFNKKSYIQSPFTCQAYYKEIITQDDKSVRYSDAILDIFIPSLFKQNKISKKEDYRRKIKVLSHRTSKDLSDSLFDIMESPYNILNNAKINLIRLDSSRFNYTINKIRNKQYYINITQKKKKYPLYKAEIVLDIKTLVIKHIIFYIPDDFLEKNKPLFLKDNKFSTSQLSSFFCKIDITQIDSLYVISNIHNHQKTILYNKEFDYSITVTRNSYLLVNSIYPIEKKIKKVLKRGQYLHKMNQKKGSNWVNYNIIKETEKDKKIKSELGLQ